MEMSVKKLLKRASAVLIRSLSFFVPSQVLFRSLLVVRRTEDAFHRRWGLPISFQKWIDHLYYSLRPSIVQTTFGQAVFYVRLNDPFHYDLVLGKHEPAIHKWLTKNVSRGMTVIDVGSNIGSYTLDIAALVGTEGVVIAVEADPATAMILKKNIQANCVPQVQVIEGAAYRTNGHARLGRAAASTGYTGLYYGKAAEWLEVPAFTLDSVVRRLGLQNLDMVKIDVEGAELDVVAGMTELLQTKRPTILIELHPAAVPAVSNLPSQLRQAGYRVEMLTRDHLIASPS